MSSTFYHCEMCGSVVEPVDRPDCVFLRCGDCGYGEQIWKDSEEDQ